MKFSVKFFLTLAILLNGFGHLSVHAHEYFTGIFQGKNLEKFQNAEFDSLQNNHATIINYAPIHIQKLNNKTYTNDTENEENELTSSRKWLVANDYYTTVFCTQVPKYLNHDIKKCLPQSKLVLPLPSCKRYIMFRVFRI